jgi:large subunit ribosomal protein L3
MWDGLITEKIGMTEVFKEDGSRVPVTILRAIPAQVIQVLTPETAGYCAVKVGYQPTTAERLPAPLRGVYEAARKKATPDSKSAENAGEKAPASGLGYFRKMMEFRTRHPERYSVGTPITPEFLKTGEKVDAIGYTKGRGFQGVVKRYRFGGGKDSHGTSVIHRRPNSIGCRWPQRVIPGKRMAGHMGNQRQTVKNLEIVRVEQDLVYVKGSVPAPKKGIVVLRPAKGWGGQS